MSNYLLDTHTFLWAVAAPERLSKNVAAILTGPGHRLYLSAASCWEILAKARKGKLDLGGGDPARRLASLLDQVPRLESLAIRTDHLIAAYQLEAHEDPIDRILMGQARVEGMILITKDSLIRKTRTISTLW